jgi:hypothetical protein
MLDAFQALRGIQMSNASAVQYIPFSTIQAGVNPYGETRSKNVEDIKITSRDMVSDLPPLDVDQDYKVIAGDRRFTAITNAFNDQTIDGDTPVPVRVWHEPTELDKAKIAITENERRKTATMVEKIAALKFAVNSGMTQAEAAALFVDGKGKPQGKAWASIMLQIDKGFEACPAFRKLVDQHDIGRRNAYELVKLCTEKVKNEETGKDENVVNAKKLEKLVEKAQTKAGAYLISPIAISQAAASRKSKDDEGPSLDGQPGDGGDGGSAAPVESAAMPSGKKIAKVVKEIDGLVVDNQDKYDFAAWKEFKKLMNLFLTGKNADALVKKFKLSAEGVKD